MNKVTAAQATKLIQQGKVGVIPTDTVYGLCADAGNEVAVLKMYALKSRDKKPGTIIAANIEQLVELGLKRRYIVPVEHYWPNQISIVIPVGLTLGYLHMGKQSLAVRIPKDEELLKLLEQTGPLVTTSANSPGDPPAKTIEQAERYFDNNVDFYVNGGEIKAQASTIIRVVDDAVEVIREGAVKIDEETGRILS